MKVFIIAEAGVNHNGSIEVAKKMVDVAVDAGVDCIKFQTFKAESLVTRTASKADYQVENTGADDSQFNMLKKLELTQSEFVELKKYCDEQNVIFLSTPFDDESIEFLDKLGMSVWKIPSGEVTNFPYLKKIAMTHVPVILSTGMCNEEEIAQAIKVLQRYGTEEIQLLHCNTEYPTPYEDVNLLAMQTMKDKFGFDIGYSDHTKGIEVPIAATALGATIIEKHFTLDKNMEGPDHQASIEPDELKSMTQAIRHIEIAMGDGIKTPSDSELRNIPIARRSIVAVRKISKGETLTEQNITVKRPGNGISAMEWEKVLGTKAIRNFEEDEMIEL